ncbi:hypothetical protein J6590_073162 [Homalodisca vitripennis]|nr:hypothetical protein J6590_073162 [Homalodisca vitripennis]
MLATQGKYCRRERGENVRHLSKALIIAVVFVEAVRVTMDLGRKQSGAEQQPFIRSVIDNLTASPPHPTSHSIYDTPLLSISYQHNMLSGISGQQTATTGTSS